MAAVSLRSRPSKRLSSIDFSRRVWRTFCLVTCGLREGTGTRTMTAGRPWFTGPDPEKNPAPHARQINFRRSARVKWFQAELNRDDENGETRPLGSASSAFCASIDRGEIEEKERWIKFCIIFFPLPSFAPSKIDLSLSLARIVFKNDQQLLLSWDNNWDNNDSNRYETLLISF